MFNFIKNLFNKAIGFIKEVANSIVSLFLKAVQAVKIFFMPRIGSNHKAEEPALVSAAAVA